MALQSMIMGINAGTTGDEEKSDELTRKSHRGLNNIISGLCRGSGGGAPDQVSGMCTITKTWQRICEGVLDRKDGDIAVMATALH